MVSQRMLQLGTARSVIRELFEYGRQRAAEVGHDSLLHQRPRRSRRQTADC